MNPIFRSLAAGAIAIAAYSCVAPANPPSLLVHREMPFTPLADITGTLVRNGACIYVTEGTARLLAIWPPDAWLDGNVIMRAGRTLAAIGSEIHLFGAYLPYENVRLAMDVDIPPACRTDQYFLVGDVGTP